MSKRYYPEKFNLVTDADEAALMIDIDRIPGENLFDYKKRVLESSSKISNSSYSGLINSINRNLGLSQIEIVEISFKGIISGDLGDPNTNYSGFVITDDRVYSGIIDGTLTKVLGNKFQVSSNTWSVNKLIGLTLAIDGNEYSIVSNTSNEIYVDREFESLYVTKSYEIKANWKPDSYINYSLILEKETYVVLANTENTITLNKPIKYREDGSFELRLSRPRVEITSSRIIFYIEYLNDDNFRIEFEVDLRENNLNHRDLCKKVNAQSRYFQMEDLIPFDNPVKAFTIKKQDSDIQVFGENIPASKLFKLKNKNIKTDTIKFSESEVFSLEEDQLPENINGAYYSVNYSEGIIKTLKLPTGSGQASYIYMDFPLRLESAPAIIAGLADEETERFLFSQKEKIIYESQKDRFVSSQPKTEMIEYISELLKVNKQSWGV
jgi:hypothetical protein